MGVTFIGAGPYGMEYLTLAGKQALMEADCILYDHLLDETMLKDVRAKCIYVGKKAHHHAYPQDEINELLVEMAKQYHRVVRLKGGDSFIFGRGGEEGIALAKHHIPFTFIPGLSSVSAVSELAGIPLTHRGVANGFVVLSAYDKDHQFPIQEHQVCDEQLTVVILMGLSRIKEIADILRKAKRKETTPIAIISQGASPVQQTLVTTLKTLEQDVDRQAPLAPALIVIGDVVNISEQLKIANDEFHQNVYVTKVGKQRSSLYHLLQDRHLNVKEIQTGEIYDLPFSVSSWQDYDTLVFTSRHAVMSMWRQLEDVRILGSFQVVAMGVKTAKVLAQYKIQADVIGDGTHETLQRLLEQEYKAGKKLLHLCGKNSFTFFVDHDAIPQCVVYENRVMDIGENDIKANDIVCFSCASAVAVMKPQLQNQPVCVAIGNTTAQALIACGMQHVRKANHADYESMMKEVLTCIEEED